MFLEPQILQRSDLTWRPFLGAYEDIQIGDHAVEYWVGGFCSASLIFFECSTCYSNNHNQSLLITMVTIVTNDINYCHQSY